MASRLQTMRRVLVSGTAASVASTAALAALARAENKHALQPVNATSHWLHGPQAASFPEADLGHTLVGYATHQAACLLWAALFEGWIARRPTHGSLFVLKRACAVSTLAALVDYRATPRRFTPGWELVLSRRSMAATYAAMALGLLAGTLGRRRRG